VNEGKSAASMLYYEPNFIGEALVLLDRFGPGARLLAGGSRVAFEVRGPHTIDALINLKRIKELSRIEQTENRLFIGALATADSIASHEVIRGCAPLLACAARSLGARQLRTVATLGGNICSGDPASDLAVALLALDAQCEILRPEHPQRSTPIRSLLARGHRVLDASELLEGVVIPTTARSWSFQKMTTRRGFEMALVSVAFCTQREGSVLREPRLAIAGAAPTCIRAGKAEEALDGQTFSLALAREAAARAAELDADPVDDWRASAQFRRHLVATLAERAMLEARNGANSGN
jgi:CO/xanthine dehydrogenase FAD-binding subunit